MFIATEQSPANFAEMPSFGDNLASETREIRDAASCLAPFNPTVFSASGTVDIGSLVNFFCLILIKNKLNMTKHQIAAALIVNLEHFWQLMLYISRTETLSFLAQISLHATSLKKCFLHRFSHLGQIIDCWRYFSSVWETSIYFAKIWLGKRKFS